jgi:anti-sigma-K factor RskA
MTEELTVHDDDQDALAAEYVLGTLSAEERIHAEALMTFDPAFEAAVRQWERRLGELNVMVEAIEPPTETWDKIRVQIGPIDLDAAASGPHEPPPLPPFPAVDLDTLPPAIESDARDISETPPPPPLDALAATSLPKPPDSLAEPSTPPQTIIERSADVIYLAGRVTRWRRATFALGALAALLALYIAAGQAAPSLFPSQMRLPIAWLTAPRTEAPTARAQQDRLVAVLQQGPTGPAFLLTVDTDRRTLTVRRVAATAEPGKTYELWLVSKRFPAPRSLGLVGGEEFTQRALPGSYDVDTLRGATYAVSLEPAGGSKTGTPTGPVLFTGKAVESLPATQPQTPRT